MPGFSDSRKQLALALAGLLPDYVIYDSPREVSKPDASKRGMLQLFRETIAPAGNLGSFSESYQLWVLDPNNPPDEDYLDGELADVVQALQPLKWLGWSTAVRGSHRDGYQAYTITVQINSNE